MRLTLLIVLASLSGAVAQERPQSVFAGIDLKLHGIEAKDAIRDARVKVRGAKVIGVKPLVHPWRVEFHETAEGVEVVVEFDRDALSACRGAEGCGPWPEALSEWLELVPLPTAGKCPGADCKIEIHADLYTSRKVIHITTKDFMLRSEPLEPPQYRHGRLVGPVPFFERPQ